MIEIYGGKIKESVYKLEEMLIETDRLITQMESVKNTLKLINDDLEADRKSQDQWADNKEAEIIAAMESVENQHSKLGDPTIRMDNL